MITCPKCGSTLGDDAKFCHICGTPVKEIPVPEAPKAEEAPVVEETPVAEEAPIVNESSYPVAACDYIIENLDLENIKLYNEYNYGSYLLYRGIPVFIDSRADLYAPEFNGTKGEDGKYHGRDIFTDYINISNISTYYEDKFEEYGITHVIIKTNSKLNMFLKRDDNYKKLYSDNNFIIYERTQAK